MKAIFPQVRRRIAGWWLAAVLLLLLQACDGGELYHFEDVGEFKFPQSFVVEKFEKSNNIQILSGKMAVEDAKWLAEYESGFEHGQPIGNETNLEEVVQRVAYVYEMRRIKDERQIYLHLDISTGKLNGYVNFIYGGGGGSFSDHLW